MINDSLFMGNVSWSLKGPFFVVVGLVADSWSGSSLLAGGVLGDSLGSLRDSVLGKLSWEEEPNSSLDFTRGDG